MGYIDTFQFWKSNEFFDSAARQELFELDPVKDAAEIEDRFYRDLEFSTGDSAESWVLVLTG